MASGFKIASAFVEVDPDATGFEDKLKAALAKSGGDKVRVGIEPDATGFDAKLKAAVASSNATATVKTSVDGTGMAAKLKADAGAAADSAGRDSGSRFGASFLSSLASKLDSGGGSSGGGGGGVAGVLNAGGVAGGALPGVAGLSGFQATIAGLGGALLAVLPAVAAVGAGLATLGGGFAVLMATNAKFKADMTADVTDIGKVFAKAAAPLAKPFEDAAAQIVTYFRGIEPDLKAVFADSAQLIEPMVKGFEALMTGAGPGFLAMIKAAGPVFSTLSGAFADLGKSLGEMFSDFAQAEGPSAVVLKAILDLVNTLFPILGKLGEVFATALAPAVSAFGAAIDLVLPALLPLATILAQLGGAVLTDLAGILGSVGTLLVGLAPSFTLLAKAAGQVFNTMENAGVFAAFSDAIEQLATPLANLVNALVKGLAPALPGLVKAFSDIATVVTAGLATVLTGVANGLTSIVNAMPPGVLAGIVAGFAALKVVGTVGGMVGTLARVVGGAITPLLNMAKAMGLVDAEMDANPIGLVIVGVAALAAGFYLAWEKSSTFRDVIKDIGVVMLGVAIVVVEAAKDITDSFLDMTSITLNAAAKAFGWIPGLGPQLKAAAAGFSGFKTSTNNAFNSLLGTLQGWQKGLTASQRTADNVTAAINKDFTNQAQAASKAKSGIDNLDVAIGTYGATSNQTKAARQQLITDLINSGVRASTAKTDVDNYSSAVAKNGTESTQAQAARQKLINDILSASNNAKAGQKALSNYTTAVKDNGSKSDAAKSARATLIKDLENAGLSAQAATSLVDSLTKAIGKIPSSKNVDLNESAKGVWSVQEALTGTVGKGGILPTPSGHAAGWLVPGFGGGDVHPALLEGGEAVVPKELTPAVAPFLRAHGVPGFKSGGLVSGTYSSKDPSGLGSWLTDEYNATTSATEAQLEAAVNAAITSAISTAKAAAASAANSGGINMSGVANSSARAALQSAAAKKGWTGAQWAALEQVEMMEAGFSLTARNPSSGAYGLAQFINGPSEYAQYGGNSTTAAGQATGMVNYVAQRYGTPSAALAHEEADHWYAAGGPILEPVRGVGLRTGETYAFGENGPETVVPGVGAAAGGGNTFQFFGTQYPTPEQLQAFTLNLTQKVNMS